MELPQITKRLDFGFEHGQNKLNLDGKFSTRILGCILFTL